MAAAPDPRLLVTLEATVVCQHELGQVGLVAAQDWVRVSDIAVLVEPDPEARPISGCPMYGPTVKPCTNTLKVQTGYSQLVRIGGVPAVLSSLSGFTDGTPAGAVKYKVNDPAQQFVRSSA